MSKDVDLYLTFPDGVFHYSCKECNAFCCRGYGFAGSVKREMLPLFARYPAIQSMAAKRAGDFVFFSTPASGCILLGSDNTCRVENELGKDAKPSICRLFPFNSFARLGKTVIVSPHFLCPLGVRFPPRPDSVEGSHSRVEAAIRASGVLNEFYINQNAPHLALHPSGDAAFVLRREKRFRDLCSRSFGERTFADAVRAECADTGSLDTFTERAARLMGLKPRRRSRRRDSLDDVLLALAPVFRMELLSLSSEGILRALAVGELIVRRIMAISSDPASPNGVYSILHANGPALRLVAREGESITRLKTGRLKSPAFGDVDLTFAAFSTLRELGNSIDLLGALERTITASLPASDRAILLTQLGRQIDRALSRPRGRRAQVA